MDEQNQSEWSTVEPGVWKPEKDGDSIEGKLVTKKRDIGINNSKAYYIEKADGTTWMCWGSTVLDDRMEFVDVNEMVRITYKGTQPNSRGQDTKIFKVEHKKLFDIGGSEEAVGE